ncbi:MAG: hypothetical protein R3C68_04805 [Myxococcota bacterium]
MLTEPPIEHCATQELSWQSAEDERRIAWKFTLWVLLTLTIVKTIAPLLGAWLSSLAFTLAAAMQLYLPLWRVDKLGLDWDFVGLHMKTWRRDTKLVLLLMLIFFPPYALGYHFYLTGMRQWLFGLGLEDAARYFPRYHFAPHLPTDLWGWLVGTWWLLKISATHSLGVALPEDVLPWLSTTPIAE